MLSPEVAGKLTPSEHKLMMVLARRCNAKVGFEPQPVHWSFCDLRKRKVYIGILNQLGISHDNYLQLVSRLQRKGFLFKSSQGYSHGRGNRDKDPTKRRVTYTRWRLPVPLLASAKQEPLFRTEAGPTTNSHMKDSHVPTNSHMKDSHVPTNSHMKDSHAPADSHMKDSHAPADRPLLDISTTRINPLLSLLLSPTRAHARARAREVVKVVTCSVLNI